MPISANSKRILPLLIDNCLIPFVTVSIHSSAKQSERMSTPITLTHLHRMPLQRTPSGGSWIGLLARLTGPPIPDLHHPTASTILTTPAEKAAALNQFFALQTDLPGRDSCPDSSQLSVNTEEFSTLQSTPAEVKRILSSLPIRKASGNDGISTRLLRECANSISVSLSALFNRSFNECHFPSAWKDALVVPVFKRGDRSNLSNYRPISLLPVVSKVCERVVYNKLSHFLSSFLSERQSGFRKGDSTSFQLTRLVQTWSEAIDRSECVGAVFFDLKKAFDRVWHDGLLVKLHAAGVCGHAFKWFSSYLSHRRQQTKVDGAVLGFTSLHAGVPQGAILSPLLFLIYLNDIPESPDFSVNLFADDTSAFVTGPPSTLNSRLQSVVIRLSAWFQKWLLCVNPVRSLSSSFGAHQSSQLVNFS